MSYISLQRELETDKSIQLNQVSELGDKMGLLNNDTSGFKSKIEKSFEFTGKIVKANADFSYPLGIEVAFWNFLEGDDVGAYSSWRW